MRWLDRIDIHHLPASQPARILKIHRRAIDCTISSNMPDCKASDLEIRAAKHNALRLFAA
jgi:hypothetical protein